MEPLNRAGPVSEPLGHDRDLAVEPLSLHPTWPAVEASVFATPFQTPDDRPVRVEFVAAVDGRLDRFEDAFMRAQPDLYAGDRASVPPGLTLSPGQFCGRSLNWSSCPSGASTVA